MISTALSLGYLGTCVVYTLVASYMDDGSEEGLKKDEDKPMLKHHLGVVVLTLKLAVRMWYVVFYWQAAWEGLTKPLIALFIFSYMLRVFANNGVGHRYFSHGSYKMSAGLEMFFAVVISMSNVRLLYWALEHMIHHARCDRHNDPHSPKNDGLFYVQFVGCKAVTVKRFFDYKGDALRNGYQNNLEWVDKQCTLLSLGEDAFWYFLFGFEAHFWARALPIVLCSHSVRLSNTASHWLGYQPYETGLCGATNCWWAALLNGGEGWHNNHHAFSRTTCHGFRWYEFDWNYVVLCGFEKLGMVWDMQMASEEVLSHYGKHERFVPTEKYVIKGKEVKKVTKKEN